MRSACMRRLVPVALMIAAASVAPPGFAVAKGDGPHIVAAGAAAAYAGTGDGRLHRIDPGCDCVTATVRAGGFPVALAATPAALWALVEPGRGPTRVRRLSPTTLEPLAPDARGVRGQSLIAAGERTIWLAGWSGRRLRGLDPATGRPVRQIELPRGIAAIAVGGERLWVALYGRRPDPSSGRRRGPGALLALDAVTGRRAAAPRAFTGRPWQLAADPRGAWLRTGWQTLLGFDTGRGIRTRVRFPSFIGSVALDGDAVWVHPQTGRGLVRVDRDDGRRRRVAASLDAFPATLAASPGSLWAGDLISRAVIRIDPQTGRVAARITLPRSAGASRADRR